MRLNSLQASDVISVIAAHFGFDFSGDANGKLMIKDKDGVHFNFTKGEAADDNMINLNIEIEIFYSYHFYDTKALENLKTAAEFRDLVNNLDIHIPEDEAFYWKIK